MNEIQSKIKELIALSNKPYDFDGIQDKMEKQDKLMNELTVLARKNKTLVGRNVRFNVADGDAVYVVIKENDKSVKVTWIDYCDGYVEMFLGQGTATMKMSMAKAYTNFEDTLESMKRK
jgi:hypothetical protein